MKIVTVVGARPQFIKASVVSRAIAQSSQNQQSGQIKETIVHTGQHFDTAMSSIFFEEMEIPAPAYHLGINSLSQGAMTGRMLEAIENALLTEKPDKTLVYGDTNSTLAAALAAAKLHIPVAHVEAGLRSFNRGMPEEINRILTDHVSDILFAPTEAAVKNLMAEGLASRSIHLVGDVMYDAALIYGEIAEKRSRILCSLNLQPKDYILATVHRAENTDIPCRLKNIWQGLSTCADALKVILPLHPRTRLALEREGINLAASNSMVICDPVGYLDMVMLERNARVIITDSGGIQKEAYFYQVPCITLREETEWVELVALGWNRLTPPSDFANPTSALDWAFSVSYCDNRDSTHPYGTGQAAKQIVSLLAHDNYNPSPPNSKNGS